MSRNHDLSIHEIEDSEDIRQRKIARRVRKRQNVKLSFLDDDIEAPVLLHKKVQHVELNRANVTSLQQSALKDLASAANVGAEPTLLNSSDKNQFESESAPAIVVSDQIQAETDVELINDIAAKAHVLADLFEVLRLHHLFQSVEENCKFRLFLHAIAFGQAAFWAKDPVMANVLRRVLTIQEVKAALEARGLEARGLEARGLEARGLEAKGIHIVSSASIGLSTFVTPTAIPRADSQSIVVTEDAHISPDHPVIKWCEPLEVPKRIRALLPQ